MEVTFLTNEDKQELLNTIDTAVGDVENALAAIISIQESLIGGETA